MVARLNLSSGGMVLGAGISAFSVVWAWGASFLSAKTIISVNAEFISYLFALVGALFGLACLRQFQMHELEDPSLKRKRDKVYIVCAGLILSVAVIAAWRQSNALFFYWAQKTTPSYAWEAIDKEIGKLQAELVGTGADKGWFAIEERHLTEPFRRVGRKAEYSFGTVHTNYQGEVEVLVAYGYQARRWGVFKGNESVLRHRWPRASIARVEGNCFYFVTSDY